MIADNNKKDSTTGWENVYKEGFAQLNQFLNNNANDNNISDKN